MSGEGSNKSGGPGQPFSWDDAPTQVRLPRNIDETPLAPAVAPSPVSEADQTAEYPVISQREPHSGEALPAFVQPMLEIAHRPDTQPFQLKKVTTVIGRGLTADLRVQDMMMSKVHASIRYTDGEFRVRDERSSNGTFLNGSKVVEYAIRDGDKLLIGDTLFRFRLSRNANG